LVIFLFHFAFFLNEYKSDSTKITLQELFDYVFKQLELSIREIGYGDVTINKKMKNYINTFYSILGKIDNWEKLDKNTKNQIFYDYLNIEKKPLLLSEYFENYRDYLKKNTFNSLLKGVINPKI